MFIQKKRQPAMAVETKCVPVLDGAKDYALDKWLKESVQSRKFQFVRYKAHVKRDNIVPLFICARPRQHHHLERHKTASNKDVSLASVLSCYKVSDPSQALIWYVWDPKNPDQLHLPNLSQTIGELHARYADEAGYLHLQFQAETSFGSKGKP